MEMNKSNNVSTIVATKNEFSIAKMTINEEIMQVGNYNGDLHVHEHDDNVELDTQPLVDEVIRESKKRKREASLMTWKWISFQNGPV
ncbi:hypothetical protein CTI12_AA533100 [Artemisia annua]|uniref:Uncharacterized protein n=1 Tax=Artemisia annua TaxID=35608 RepID=A0A2U1L444_ARTAN|nr:hypothetical protein CTI12_AA533090 [Artemisia annua]PWA43771.1 hypothetical protein CTI12_AA533100 [Artemisia annua]